MYWGREAQWYQCLTGGEGGPVVSVSDWGGGPVVSVSDWVVMGLAWTSMGTCCLFGVVKSICIGERGPVVSVSD